MIANEDHQIIGIFDSGIGGLSVLRHVRVLLPAASILYLADQAHVPYGRRPATEVQRFSLAISRFLIDQGAELIIVACNTATAAALEHLRANLPEVPFVGMEPAVKPAALTTETGHIGVLATAGTFVSQRYADLMDRFASGVTVLQDPCPGLVEQIEAGRLADPATEQIIRRAVGPMLAEGVDTLVLGCTHYPFVIPLIERVAGSEVTIIDPAPAVARQAERVLNDGVQPRPDGGPGRTWLLTTGDPVALAEQASQLLGGDWPSVGLVWRDDGRLAWPAVPGDFDQSP